MQEVREVREVREEREEREEREMQNETLGTYLPYIRAYLGKVGKRSSGLVRPERSQRVALVTGSGDVFFFFFSFYFFSFYFFSHPFCVWLTDWGTRARRARRGSTGSTGFLVRIPFQCMKWM